MDRDNVTTTVKLDPSNDESPAAAYIFVRFAWLEPCKSIANKILPRVFLNIQVSITDIPVAKTEDAVTISTTCFKEPVVAHAEVIHRG
jgi:hypothetical protein